MMTRSLVLAETSTVCSDAGQRSIWLCRNSTSRAPMASANSMRFHYILIGGLAAVLLLTAAIGIGWYRTKGEVASTFLPPSIGGPFALTDGDGHPVTDQTYRGKWLVVYFGYTYCPDACPTGLNNIAGA